MRDTAYFTSVTNEARVFKILNLKTGNIIATYSESSGVGYSVSMSYSDCAYLVTKQEVDNGETYYVYDSTGSLLFQDDERPEAPTYHNIGGDDFVLYKSKAYLVEDDGSLTKQFNVPEYENQTFEKIDYVGKRYIFDIDTDAIKIYDMSLGFVAAYAAPTYSENAMAFILDNENVVFQYMVSLPDDESKYDIFDDGTKYDLVTEIINIEKDEKKEVNVDYVIGTVAPKFAIDSYLDNGSSPFVDKYENIASIYRIRGKRYDTTVAAVDYVFLGNDLKVGESGKLHNNQRSAGIERLSDNRYLVSIYNGYAVVDERGEFVKGFSADMENFGGVLYCDNRAYDSNLKVISDFSDSDVEILAKTDGAMIIDVEDGYAKYLIANGKITKIYSYSAAENASKAFSVTSFGYSVYSSEKDVYEHYNFSGDKFLETKASLEELNNAIYKSENKYYLFVTE